MKKNNNIKQLKEIVNNDLFFDLHHQGVQAYNISSANEYEVITGFRKCNGRYYFIDRNRNKYLASRYDRADFIAGEMLEQKERENETVAEAIEGIEKTGKTKILIDLAWEYIKACKDRGINPGELVDTEEDNAGNVYTIHCIEPTKDEENNEDNENAAACEPSKLAGILAKMKNGARKVCEKVATVAFFSGAVMAAFLALYVAIVGLTALLDVCGIEGGSLEAIALSVLLLFTVIMDFCVFVELNTMALFSKLFKVEDFDGRIMRFTRPFSVVYQLIKQSRE